MDRRSAIACAGAAMLVGATSLGAQKPEKEHEFDLAGYESSLSTISTIEDDDVGQIKVTVYLKKGYKKPLDSYVVERALLKHVGSNLLPWFQYCRNTGRKTL